MLIDFGLITLLLIDDAATGAWNQFDKTKYMIDMQCYAVTTQAQVQAQEKKIPAMRGFFCCLIRKKGRTICGYFGTD